jgi:hypothetical protein
MAERRPRIVAVFGEAAADTVHRRHPPVLPRRSCDADQSVNLAVEDSRDLMVWAAELRSQRR